MKQSTLYAIKSSIRDFEKVINDLVTCFGSTLPHLKTMGVIVHNMGFNSLLNSNEDIFKERLEEFNQYHKLLNSFNTYYNSHFENFICGEINNIVMGLEISEEYE